MRKYTQRFNYGSMRDCDSDMLDNSEEIKNENHNIDFEFDDTENRYHYSADINVRRNSFCEPDEV